MQNSTQETSTKASALKITNTRSVLISLVSGAIAGGIAKTTIAPLDRTKISFQVSNQQYSCHKALRFLNEAYSKDGVLSLWRGNSATMARIVPYAAIQFTSHEQWKILLGVDSHKNKTKGSGWARFLAGSLAGVTSQSLTYPLDLARARMAVTPKQQYASLTQVFVKIWHEEGFLAFYKGFVPTLVGVIPYAGTSFFTYATLRNLYTERYGSGNAITNLVCGAVAGLVGQSTSYPLDIVRRRMQTSAVMNRQKDYLTIRSTLTSIYREEGIKRGFFKGLSMNWVKGPIAVGISFATYDHIRSYLSSVL